jgi:hypothetical protein
MVAGSCEVTDITTSDQISFRPGKEFIAEAPNHWYLPTSIMTPLESAVVKADAALTSTPLHGTTVVIIMTDGEPSCNTDSTNVIATVSKWNTSGTKTYVVGLPGSEPAKDFLTELAVSGGTNTFFVPDEPAALQNKISTIVKKIAKKGLKTCTINLHPKQGADLANLHLIVDEGGVEKEVLRQFSGGGGWSVSADGTVATLEGALCNMAINGRFVSIRFDFGCVNAPILL